MDYNENRLSQIIIGSSIKVHSKLGPGLLENAYEECLYFELKKIGLDVEKQKGLPLYYETIKLELGYRVDLMVNQKVIVELKAVETINDVHVAQILTYLKLSNCKLGLLINFNVPLLKDGIRRIVNGL